MTDIEFIINENTKTTTFLGGNFSGDTGFGIGLGLRLCILELEMN